MRSQFPVIRGPTILVKVTVARPQSKVSSVMSFSVRFPKTASIAIKNDAANKYRGLRPSSSLTKKKVGIKTKNIKTLTAKLFDTYFNEEPHEGQFSVDKFAGRRENMGKRQEHLGHFADMH
jgi:hypothetical protein